MTAFCVGYLYVCIGADGITTVKGGDLTDFASNFSMPKAVMPDPCRNTSTDPKFLTSNSQDKFGQIIWQCSQFISFEQLTKIK